VMLFRDWADHPSESGKANERTLDRKLRQGSTRIVGGDPDGLDAPDPIDERDGPEPCCKKRRVAADTLVWYGDLPPGLLAKVRARFPHMDAVADVDLYLCDGCRETLRRERVLLRPELPSWKNDPTSRRYREKNP
jgi:hypothetical protein